MSANEREDFSLPFVRAAGSFKIALAPRIGIVGEAKRVMRKRSDVFEEFYLQVALWRFARHANESYRNVGTSCRLPLRSCSASLR